MTRRARRRAQKAPVTDSFQNVQARMGIGTDTLASSASYALNPITRNRQLLDSMYRGSWLVGAAVDTVADDMTRDGIDVSQNVAPDDAETLQNRMSDLNILEELGDGVRWSRLYGGAVCVILIEGQDFATPLRTKTIGRGKFHGLLTLDRWQLAPTITEVVKELGPNFGKPEFYTVVHDPALGRGQASPLLGQRIHHSRVIRFEGIRLPAYQRMAEMGWGMSVVERLNDRLLAFDSSTQGAAQLIYRSHLRTMKVDGLTKILAAGGPAASALVKRLESIRQFQSSEGLTLIDTTDEMEHFTQNFAGLSDMILQFGQQLSGALQIPLVRLFGQSPAGLNSSGDSDLRTYYDGISKEQSRVLRGPIMKVIEIMHMSELGRPIDPGFMFEFATLWKMTETEKADVAARIGTLVRELMEGGIIGHALALGEMRRQSAITGILTGITDEDIADAEEEDLLPDPMEGMIDPETGLPLQAGEEDLDEFPGSEDDDDTDTDKPPSLH